MLRGIWTLFVLTLATVVFSLPVAVGVLIVPRWSNSLVILGRTWSRIMLATVGARVTIHGRENVTKHSPCVFISNHGSFVDIWALLLIIPDSTRFVAKRELFRIPVFGWALSASGCIPIDRGNRGEAIRSLRMAAQRIKSGISVILFPEGTRSKDGRLAPFKKGAFHLALHAGVPLVPVAISGSFAVMPPRSIRVRPGPVEVHVEPPIVVSRFRPDDHESLRAEVQAIIARRMDPEAPGDEPDAVPLETP